jgi:PleD family two-component response regulator
VAAVLVDSDGWVSVARAIELIIGIGLFLSFHVLHTGHDRHEFRPFSKSSESGRYDRMGDVVWILVVEDETAMREAVRQGLEEDNHTVALASDGLEGIHAAESCDFDAILLDVMMPGMDGVELVRRLRAGRRMTVSVRRTPSALVRRRGA